MRNEASSSRLWWKTARCEVRTVHLVFGSSYKINGLRMVAIKAERARAEIRRVKKTPMHPSFLNKDWNFGLGDSLKLASPLVIVVVGRVKRKKGKPERIVFQDHEVSRDSTQSRPNEGLTLKQSGIEKDRRMLCSIDIAEVGIALKISNLRNKTSI